jgi:P27 family predicted phage terminase small subunit
MRVGAKGGGKHWTEEEVQKRTEAGKKFERKKKRSLKGPSWLDEDAKKVWSKTVKDMKDFDILDKVDEDVLAAYCDAVAKHQAMNRLIDVHGYTTVGPGGTDVISPYVKMAQTYARMTLQFAEKLGLTASARARLAKKMADNEGDKNDDLFD